METKNMFKALAMVMLMPAMLLTTACSNDDFAVNDNTEIVNQKGFTIPVTINVTRQGDDATMRATYTDNGNGTGTLGFSTGDKLLVKGTHEAAENFAGVLTWVSGGTFSGTILTDNPYGGTAEALLSGAQDASAMLLPVGYDTYGYLSIKEEGTTAAYIDKDDTKLFALTKAAAVEQFSEEYAGSYSSGFALIPYNAILNFTISGLSASADVDVALTGSGYNITGSVTTNGSGVASFAIGVAGGTDFNDLALTVGGNDITLASGSKTLTAGKIYNVTRSAAPAPAATDLSTINANYTASDGETLTGTLASNVKISIADGATVTLDNVTINGVNSSIYNYAGITCEGDATIILSGTNTVNGFYEDYPGIQAAAGKTLIINGTGSLTASSYGWGAGIGGGSGVACGDIEIQGGIITATSGEYGAGIGGGNNASWGNITISGGTVTATGGKRGAGIGGGRKGLSDVSCGNILISGGTVTATGGENAAGIGGGRGYNSGSFSSCGTITITTGVTKVTATKGDGADNSIGAGKYCTCGTVTIGGTVYWDGSAYKNGGDTYLPTSPLVFPAP